MPDERMTEAITSQREPERVHEGEFLSNLTILKSILNWLAGLFQLTEDEQRDAGIYVGNQRFQ
jgi:hypothetical protein